MGNFSNIISNINNSGTARDPDTAIFGGGLHSSNATGGIGYDTGAGGSVTQLTSRTTGVTLNAICGTITTDDEVLLAEENADFTVTNSAVAIGDVVAVCIQSGGDSGSTVVEVVTVAAGSFVISVANHGAAAPYETAAILINFAILKSVSA